MSKQTIDHRRNQQNTTTERENMPTLPTTTSQVNLAKKQADLAKKNSTKIEPVTVTSRYIAVCLSKKHSEVLRAIRKLIKRGDMYEGNVFIEDYRDKQNKERPQYVLNYSSAMDLLWYYTPEDEIVDRVLIPFTTTEDDSEHKKGGSKHKEPVHKEPKHQRSVHDVNAFLDCFERLHRVALIYGYAGADARREAEYHFKALFGVCLADVVGLTDNEKEW